MASNSSHSFAICAYGESPYLEDCIQSVLRQNTIASETFIATSTPNDYINQFANQYSLPVFVNKGESGIGQDWNFAYSKSTGDYITIAHQDDVYCENYANAACRYLDASSDPIIFFSNYGELRNDARVDDTHLLKVKRKMLAPISNGRFAHSRFMRRRILSFGSPICCPAVTLVRSKVPELPYMTKMKASLDWDTWEALSRLNGDFLYSTEILMYHRIHEDSATSSLIESQTRSHEDREMFERFWPKPIASLLESFYSRSEKSNETQMEN